MEFVEEFETDTNDNLLLDQKVKLYVVYRILSTLDNVIGTFSNVNLAYEAIKAHVPPKKITISVDALASLLPSGESIPVSKDFEPELRVAICAVNVRHIIF